MLNRASAILLIAIGITVWAFVITSVPTQYALAHAEKYSLHNTVKMTAWVLERPADIITSVFDTMAFGVHENPEESVLAEYGLTENFYAEFSSNFVATEENDVTFIIQSTGTFTLMLDNTEILSDKTAHSLTEQRSSISVRKGKHTLTLRYFSTTGPYSLNAYYSTPVVDEMFFIGESSTILKFKAM